MTTYELVLIGISLAMDAFAVSLCIGFSMKIFKFTGALKVGLCFGIFQAFMPFLGWYLGSKFSRYIVDYDHWVAFLLLVFIGVHMILESRENNEDEVAHNDIRIRTLLIMGLATSIDALAIGVSFAVLPDINTIGTCLNIGVITFVIAFSGVFIGKKSGDKFKGKAELSGGTVLILIGCKILIEHLFFH